MKTVQKYFPAAGHPRGRDAGAFFSRPRRSADETGRPGRSPGQQGGRTSRLRPGLTTLVVVSGKQEVDETLPVGDEVTHKARNGY